MWYIHMYIHINQTYSSLSLSIYLYIYIYINIYKYIYIYIDINIIYRPRTLVVHSAWKLSNVVPRTLWVGVLRTLKGHPPVSFLSRTLAAPFYHSFFDIVLVPSFFGFWCQLGANLPPKTVPKSIRNRSKSRPTSIPTSILSSITFFIDF